MSENNWKAGDSDEGLAPRDFPRGDAYDVGKLDDGGLGRTERAKLIRQMEADREERRTRKGSPNRLARYDIGASAKVYGLRALATIVEIMENEKEAAPVRLAAAREVLDRGFGRPKSMVEVGGLDGDEIRSRLVIEFVGVKDQGRAVENGGTNAGKLTPSQVGDKWASEVGRVIENQHTELVKSAAVNGTEVEDVESKPVPPRPSFVR